MVSPSKHKCDRHLISLYTITSESNVKVMSTKEMITLLPNSYRVTEAVESLGTRLGNERRSIKKLFIVSWLVSSEHCTGIAEVMSFR